MGWPRLPFPLLWGIIVLLAAAPVSSAADRDTEGEPARETARPLVAIALVDALNVGRWLANPPSFLEQAARRGGIALIGTRVDGPYSSAAVHLTLGTGTPARAGSSAQLAFDGDEQVYGFSAAHIYRRRFGTEGGQLPEPAIVHLGFAELAETSRRRPFHARPGALGEGWVRQGMRVTLLGNADVPGERRRHGVLLAMDDRGRIVQGRIGPDTLVLADDFPFGPRTDYRRLLEETGRQAPVSDVIIVELGDLARLGQFYLTLPPPVYRRFYDESLARIDAFLADWMHVLQEASPGRPVDFWFIAPTPSPEQGPTYVPAGALLRARFPAPRSAAAAAEGGGGKLSEGARSEPHEDFQDERQGPALLLSPSTRRPGIVAATDIMPALLAASSGSDGAGYAASHQGGGFVFSYAEPQAMAAHLPLPPPEDADGWQMLHHFLQRAAVVHKQRPSLLRIYVSLTVIILLAAAAALWWRRGPEAGSPDRFPGVSALLLFVNAVPVALLLAPFGQRPTLAGNVAAVGLIGLGFTLAAGQGLLWGRQRPPAVPPALPFVRLALAGAGLIAVDVLRGSPWMKHSFLGYDPFLGARYYGIGNEYMGFFIAACLIGSTGWLDGVLGGRPPTRSALIAVTGGYAVAAALIALPGLGANVGGAVTALASFAVTARRLWRARRWEERRTGPEGLWAWAAAVLAAGGVMLAIGLWDAYGSSMPGHWGRFLVNAREEGWAYAAATVQRKMLLNVRLFYFTVWSRVLVLSAAITTALLYRPPASLRDVLAGRRPMAIGLRGTVLAGVIAFLVNDSGVVAAATSLIPATTLLLHLMHTAGGGLGGGGQRFEA